MRTFGFRLFMVFFIFGLAGFTDKEIAPLFEKAHDVENIVLPPGMVKT